MLSHWLIVRSFLASAILAPVVLTAQEWSWARSGGGPLELDAARGVCADRQGNYYVTGYFSGTAVIGGTTLTSRGGTEVFIASFTAAGEPRWAKRAGSTRDDYGMAITVDDESNIYFVGSCGDSADFEDSTLVAREVIPGMYYIVSYRGDGTIRWAQKIDGGGGFPMGVSVNRTGSLAVTGYARSLQFTEDVALLMIATDIFTAVYSSGTGGFQWARAINANATTEGIREGKSVAIDDNHNVFVTGYIANGARFDGSTVFFAEGPANVFVARYDAGGTFRWVWKGGGPNYDAGTGVVVNEAGDLFVAGYYQGPFVVAPGDTLPATNYLGDVWVARFTGDGALVWVRSAGGSGRDEAGGIALAPNGDVVIGGLFSSTATFGNARLTAAGTSDLFLAQYRSNGDLVGAIGGGGQGEDFGYGVAVGPTSQSCVVGSFQGTASFGTHDIAGAGGTDVAIAAGVVNTGAVRAGDPSLSLAISYHGSKMVITNHAGVTFHGRLRLANLRGELLVDSPVLVEGTHGEIEMDEADPVVLIVDLRGGDGRPVYSGVVVTRFWR